MVLCQDGEGKTLVALPLAKRASIGSLRELQGCMRLTVASSRLPCSRELQLLQLDRFLEF